MTMDEKYVENIWNLLKEAIQVWTITLKFILNVDLKLGSWLNLHISKL